MNKRKKNNIGEKKKTKRKIGTAKGKVKIEKDFNSPLIDFKKYK